LTSPRHVRVKQVCGHFCVINVETISPDPSPLAIAILNATISRRMDFDCHWNDNAPKIYIKLPYILIYKSRNFGQIMKRLYSHLTYMQVTKIINFWMEEGGLYAKLLI
jgi:hypothetical protein